MVLAGRKRLIRGVGLSQRILGIVADERANLPVNAPDLFLASLQRLAC